MATKTVDEYIQKYPQWEEDLSLLRAMLRSTEMGSPVTLLTAKMVQARNSKRKGDQGLVIS